MRRHFLPVVGLLFLTVGCQTVMVQPLQSSVPVEVAVPIGATVPVEVATPIITNTPSIKVVRQPQSKAKTKTKAKAKSTPTDIWQRIRLGLSMPIPNQKLINYYRDWYIKHPQHLEEVSRRATPFMYLIVDEIQKRQLPMELALLPIVESAFDPLAYSKGAAASGLWQFTPSIAKHFGLQINWWYDGRRDVPAATTAALDLLEYLHNKIHNNWLYAIAAYNTGEGRVFNGIKSNRKRGLATDFWALDLPRETEHYVPQLLALADVIKNAQQYGIKLHFIPNRPYLKVVDIGSQIDLALAAGMADMSINQLHLLNPGFDRWATSPYGPHNLVLPVKKVLQFNKRLAATSKQDRIQFQRYKIKSGDSLSIIAKQFKTSTQALIVANNIKSNVLVAGRYLLIPSSAEQRQLTKPQLRRKIYYTVRQGDSLSKIAQRHNVKTASLARWNDISTKEVLHLGQRLVIWKIG